MCKDGRVVPGAGATEMELAKRLKEFGRKETGYAGRTGREQQSHCEQKA